MIFSGLKRDSAKSYLDGLCKGDHPSLWKVRESRRWLYFPKREVSKEYKLVSADRSDISGRAL